jgi:Sigma-70 region 2
MERKHRFEELFADYSSDIVAYCRWRASSISDAEDAASEVFLTVWRRLDRLPDGEGARIWLYATARSPREPAPLAQAPPCLARTVGRNRERVLGLACFRARRRSRPRRALPTVPA